MIKKILSAALFIFVMWAILWGIPIDYYSRETTVFAFAGSIFGGITLAIAIYQLAKKNGDSDSQYGCSALVALLFVFGFGFFLMYHYDNTIEQEFEEHGIPTLAAVKDGSSVKGKSFDFTSVKVVFYNKEGEKRYADINMSAYEFNDYRLDQQLPIVYSERHQTMARIVLPDKSK